MHTLVTLLPDEAHVASAGNQLWRSGVAVKHTHEYRQAADVLRMLHGRQQFSALGKKVLAGTAVGIAIGLLYGIPAGLLNCRLMSCPLATSLLMLALITAYWAAGGAIVGAIIGFDALEWRLLGYLRGIRQGEILFLVEADDTQVDTAVQILEQADGSLIHVIN